jgi:hypothetical protein
MSRLCAQHGGIGSGRGVEPAGHGQPGAFAAHDVAAAADGLGVAFVAEHRQRAVWVRRAVSAAAALAAGWDAFELLAATADECADRADAMFAAFMMAIAAAADGRDALAAAPSLPPEPEVEAEAEAAPPAAVPGDVAQVVAGLAGLAADLTACLSAAVQAAAGITDRTACERAAREAGRIHDLLAGDR